VVVRVRPAGLSSTSSLTPEIRGEDQGRLQAFVEKLGMYQTLDELGLPVAGDVPTFQPSGTSMSFTTATIVARRPRQEDRDRAAEEDGGARDENLESRS
jgi:hypothetical protein